MIKKIIIPFTLFCLHSCHQQNDINSKQIIDIETIDTVSMVLNPIFEEINKDSFLTEKNTHNRPARVIESMDEYRLHIQKFPNHQMVSLTDFIPKIKIDLRYSHYDNIFNDILYVQGEAFLNITAAESLKKVQEEIAQDGYELVIWDAYRPYSVTVKMWNIIQDSRYAATPQKGSRHNRGMAVDVTLKKINGEYLEMPTEFDNFSKKASPLYQNLAQNVIENRDYLISKMHKHGFRVISSEWWHFDYQNWYSVPIMDIPLEKMSETQ